jgi:hypothetical protein
MLHLLLTSHRTSLLEQCVILSGIQFKHTPEQVASLGQISIFLDQLILTLQSEDPAYMGPDSGEAVKETPSIKTQMFDSAKKHGGDLQTLGFTIEEVVRSYGGLCQAITTLAVDRDVPIAASEFRTMNRCLDDGIAEAVTSFSRLDSQKLAIDAKAKARVQDHVSMDRFATMSYYVESARMAVTAIRTGKVGMEGATAGVLDRNLIGLQTLILEGVANTPV